MAVPNRGQIVASTWEVYAKKSPQEQIFGSYWLLDRLKAKARKLHGRSVNVTIEYAPNTTVKPMSELETLDITRVDVFDQAEYPWKFLGGDIVMSEFEEQANSNGGGKFELEAAKMKNLKNSFMQNMSRQAYSDGTGTGGKEIGGLQYLVSTTPTTGSPGTINRATYTFWRNQQVSGAKSTTTYDNYKGAMRSAYNLASTGIGEHHPTFAVTNRTDFEGFESLHMSIERLNRTSANDKLVTGFKGSNFMFKDIPLAYDTDAPAGSTYILNDENLFLVYMLWMKAFPPGTPVNQFAKVVKVFHIWNMVTDNPRRLAVVSGTT